MTIIENLFCQTPQKESSIKTKKTEKTTTTTKKYDEIVFAQSPNCFSKWKLFSDKVAHNSLPWRNLKSGSKNFNQVIKVKVAAPEKVMSTS